MKELGDLEIAQKKRDEEREQSNIRAALEARNRVARGKMLAWEEAKAKEEGAE